MPNLCGGVCDKRPHLCAGSLDIDWSILRLAGNTARRRQRLVGRQHYDRQLGSDYCWRNLQEYWRTGASVAGANLFRIYRSCHLNHNRFVRAEARKTFKLKVFQ